MDTQQKAKLERYLRNSSRFLWGLGVGKQDVTYSWLEGKGYRFNRGPYSKVTDQLLKDPGIEKIIIGLVIPRVKEMYSISILEALHQHWYAGLLPDISFVKTNRVAVPFPFLEINIQYDYVERWGEFAGIWFEEIEPDFKV